MPIILDGDLGITTPALTVTGVTVNTGGISTAGNLTFTSTGQRITGDFSNATISNRLSFQNSTTNGTSVIQILPNGTGGGSGYLAFTSSDANNSSYVRMVSLVGSTSIQSSYTGTGTYLPLTFYTGGSENMRIDASGYVLIGATSATGTNKLQVSSDALINGLTVGKGGGAVANNTAVGLNALNINATGVANVAIGNNAMALSIATNYNTAVGDSCLTNLTTGNGICAFGHAALLSNTSGQYNTAYGSSSLRAATTGAYNTGIGYGALTFLTTGTYNSVLGINSGREITTGSYNVIIGSYSGNAGGLDIRTSSNYVVLSDGAGNIRQVIDSSGNVGIGTSSFTNKFNAYSSTGNVFAKVYNDLGAGFYGVDSSGAAYCWNQGNQPLYFGTNDIERMRITSAGSVGIGLTNPEYKLQVTASLKGLFVESGAGGYTSLGFKSTGGVTASLTTSASTISIGSINGSGTGSNGEIVIFPSTANRLAINTNGQITMPYQPSFFAIKTSAGAAYTVGTPILFNVIPTNVGSNYSAATGRFTAPVYGVYYFSMKNLQINTASVIRFYFYLNGAQADTTYGLSGADGAYQSRFESTTGNNKEQQTSAIMTLNAGDYVTVVQKAGTASVDDNGYSTFLGHLIG